jgi:ribosome-associated translation inhibitor RaiA
MSDPGNQIVFLGTKPTRPLERFVQKQLKKWLEQERSFSQFTEHCSFRVMIEKDERRPRASCHIQVRTGSQTLESQESGKTIQLALIHAIERLRSSRAERPEPVECSEYVEGAS